MNLKNVFLILCAFVIGALSTLVFMSQATEEVLQPSYTFSEKRESGYKHINPLLECEYLQDIDNTDLGELKEELEKIVNKHSNTDIGLYYRDLTNGPWFGIGYKKQFSPQSLLKLPVAIAYYKLAENNPDILSENIMYTSVRVEKNLDDNLTVGEEYAVGFLIERMLKLSDNVAFELLTSNIDSKFIRRVHTDLGIPYPNEKSHDEFISVKDYASLFRVLYNSSYISRESSENVLSILLETDFNGGLVAGVPTSISVAHKYGIRDNLDSKQTQQLHDCGIVYHPQNPYILCIMTKGRDVRKLADIIQDIAKTTYETVNTK